MSKHFAIVLVAWLISIPVSWLGGIVAMGSLSPTTQPEWLKTMGHWMDAAGLEILAIPFWILGPPLWILSVIVLWLGPIALLTIMLFPEPVSHRQSLQEGNSRV